MNGRRHERSDASVNASDMPMLTEPNVMLVALKTTAAGPATPDDCVARLEGSLRLAGFSLSEADRESLGRRIDLNLRCFHVVRLVDRVEGGKFAITSRGRETLRAHPMGIDTSVLSNFPEFRAFNRRRRSPRNGRMTVAPAVEYSEGYMAGLGGRQITDNPYSADASAHLEWENGWCEARDQKIDVVPFRTPAVAGNGKED